MGSRMAQLTPALGAGAWSGVGPSGKGTGVIYRPCPSVRAELGLHRAAPAPSLQLCSTGRATWEVTGAARQASEWEGGCGKGSGG